MLQLPIGGMTKADVRAHAERLGMRTWDKPDSQDVCFIEASKGREAFLSSRVQLTPATFVDLTSGEELGTTEAAQLVTVGQRRGVLPDRDGERRFVQRVDLAAKKIFVGRLDDVVVTRLDLDTASVTFAREPLASGARVWAQCSAHGEPKAATLHFDGRWWVELDAPARPVAAGQSVVFYRFDEPDVVEGAALVVRP
jgi:tRNA-specific 2-thiouridylase